MASEPQTTPTKDWATAWAEHLVAKWEHGDEAHRQWLRDVATSDLAWALRHASLGRTYP